MTQLVSNFLLNRSIKVKLRSGKVVEGVSSESDNSIPQITIAVPGFKDIDYTFQTSWSLLSKAVNDSNFEIKI